MVILATDMEKVEDEGGIDEIIAQIAQMCRTLKVPLVYILSRNRLGSLAKYKGQHVSAVGVQNFQGANDVYKELVELTEKMREKFYEGLMRNMQTVDTAFGENVGDLIMLRKENPFLNWNHPKVTALMANMNK